MTSARRYEGPAEPQPVESPNPGLPIAEVARRTGLSKDTLRYYEKAGLIEAVKRSSGGQRGYYGERQI